MTISTTTTRISYAGTSTTAIYPYTFKILEDANLVVIQTDDATEVSTQLVLNSDYVVSGAGDESGGYITLTAGVLETGQTLLITRFVNLLQNTEYTEGDDFPAQSHEDALDYLTMIDQQQQTTIDDLVASVSDIASPLRGLTLEIAGAVTFNAFASAGYVKNSAAGVLSTGDIEGSDITPGIDAEKVSTGVVDNDEFDCLAGVTSNIQAQINALIGGSIAQSYAIIMNRQAASTAGGTSTAGAWQDYPFTVEQSDINGFLDFSSPPAFSLDAGTYMIDGIFPFYGAANGNVRLYNVTDAAVENNIYGTINTTAGVQQTCALKGIFTIAGTKQFKVQYYIATGVVTNGLGIPGSLGSALEVYGQATITQIA